MRAGVLNRQITLQARSTTRDAAGEPVRTWTNVATTWAGITPLSGRELELAQAINSEISHQVSIRYRTGVTPTMRIVYQGRYFNILSVIDVEMKHRELQILAAEGLSDA